MFTVTPQAEAKILEFMQAQSGKSFLKIQVRGQSASEYLVHFLLEDQKKETESQFDHQTFSILYDTIDGNKIQNSTVQWIESVSGSGFRLDNPNKPENNLDSPLAVRVQEILIRKSILHCSPWWQHRAT
ncbi:MAG: iron-sulfur cluster biosynthesis family protein [Bdellovibrionota bacterium]